METIAIVSAIVLAFGIVLYIIANLPPKPEKVELDDQLQQAYESLEITDILRHLQKASDLIDLHGLEEVVNVKMLRSTLNHAREIARETQGSVAIKFIATMALRELVSEIEIVFTDTRWLEGLSVRIMCLGGFGLGATVIYNAIVRLILSHVVNNGPNI